MAVNMVVNPLRGQYIQRLYVVFKPIPRDHPAIRETPYTMNRYVFITVICLASCAQQPKQPPAPEATTHPSTPASDTLLWIRDRIFDHDTDYVRVSYQLESDTLYNHLLATYIANYRYGGVVDWPEDKLDSVVNRPSFIRMVLLFQGKTAFHGISYNQETYHLEDFADALLFPSDHCSRSRFYTIADTLLTQDNFKAVESLWEKADLKRLPSFEPYVSRVDTGNFMKLADLAAFFHNKGLYARRDSCMARAQKLSRWHKEYQLLARLFAKKKPFSFLDYDELLYNDYGY
jgi:hypothetical protein